jgi:hypothetical protein
MQQWSYFDFDANWDKFLDIWNSDFVQEELEEQMESWCETDAPWEDGKPMTYERGDQLWEFGRTDYWHEKIMSAGEEEEHEMYKIFSKRLQQIHPQMFVDDIDHVSEWNYSVECGFADEVGKQTWEKYKPKKDSLESFIMMMGKNYVSHALYVAAFDMFDDDEPTMVKDCDGNDLILFSNKKIVFDLYNFYFLTRDEDTNESFILRPDAYYDDKCA